MRVLTAILLLIAPATGSCREADGQDLLAKNVAPLVDHHQHLLSPAGAALQNAYRLCERLPYDVEQPVVGEHLVAMLDRAGIKRAVVLSDAYWFDSPPRARTLRDMFKGLKLHFAASAVDLKSKHHVERVRRIFEAANAHRLAIIVHVRGDRSYGREHAEIFLTQLLPAAPDIPVQIAHLWGGDGFSEGALTALIVYADAVSAHHRATRNLYFDVTQLALILGGQKDALQRMATLIRQIGVGRILYGSDGPIFGNVQPSEAWGAFRREMPLTGEEFRTIANNIAPYAR